MLERLVVMIGLWLVARRSSHPRADLEHQRREERPAHDQRVQQNGERDHEPDPGQEAERQQREDRERANDARPVTREIDSELERAAAGSSSGRRDPAAERDARIVLTEFTIYHQPDESPGGFVVREWHFRSGDTPPLAGRMWRADSLHAARMSLPGQNLVCLGRARDDDRLIVETWT
jgi:hypothetical protein